MSGGFLQAAFVYLAAAVIAVPLAKRLGLGSVLGYILAGVAIGPFGLQLVGGGGAGGDVMHVAELGVVMMLFVIGLELEPSLLWRLRGPILGLGGVQLLLTTAVVAGIAMAVGLDWRVATMIGLTLSLSSTAIVLQMLGEKGLLRTVGGQSSFAVLLFQDVAVIPMLALVPLLAAPGARASDLDAAHRGATLVSGLPGWAQTIAVLAAVALVIVGGRFVVRPAFRVLARMRSREIFTAAALLLVVGIALLMTLVGLSPALGTFLGGVVLATSEYRHELESDVEPFKGLLLGLFFIAVGASIDFALVMREPGLIAGLVAAVIAVKALVLLAGARVFGLATDQGLLLAFALAQVGEFAFVLLAFARQEGVLGERIASPLVAVVALTMAITPLLMLVYERVIRPSVGTPPRGPAREPDAIERQERVLIAGFGSFGSTVGRLLRANGIRATVLDIDSDRVELLRRMGLEVHYGDATRPELLEAAGASRASVLLIALDTPERTLQVARLAQRNHPHLDIYARAFDWDDAHDLIEAGVTHVYRESTDAAIRTGEDAMRALGFRAYQAKRAAHRFLRHDEESVRELTSRRRDDRAGYIGAARRRIEELERIMEADRGASSTAADAGWDAESLREEAKPRDGGTGGGPSAPGPASAR